MNKWFAGCDNVKLFELHKKVMKVDRNAILIMSNVFFSIESVAVLFRYPFMIKG